MESGFALDEGVPGHDVVTRCKKVLQPCSSVAPRLNVQNRARVASSVAVGFPELGYAPSTIML